MNRKLKEILKNHITAVKNMYPEVHIEVRMIHDEIFICIDSIEISNEEKYIDLLYDFSEEYDSYGFFGICWGVNSSLTADNLMMFKNLIKIPKKETYKKEILKKNGMKKMPLAKAHS